MALIMMPELPEVETLRRGLSQKLPGAVVASVEVHQKELRKPIDVGALRRLTGLRVSAVHRRAKYLVVELEAGMALILHLGMSGRLLLVPAEVPLDRHDHVRLRLEGPELEPGVELRFRDPRRFGLVLVARFEELDRHPLFRHLGVDPFEAGFSPGYLRRAACRSRRPVKNLLMDARVVSGIGNIYACELLWLASVHPRTVARRISMIRWTKLHAACQEVLRAAIAEGGTTLNDFCNEEGQAGYFAVRLRVYGREAEGCSRCGRSLRRIIQAGRSTFYCPGCQH